MPKAPKIVPVVPTAENQKVPWRYTTQRPNGEWFQPGFDAGSWKEGTAGFGTRGTPGSIIGTEWSSRTIWLRREFTLPERELASLHFRVHHDEDVEVYLNGVRALELSGYTTGYETAPIAPAARAALKPGKNIIAIRCRQTNGGQYIDCGLVEVIPVE